jgi:hypothetical protein
VMPICRGAIDHGCLPVGTGVVYHPDRMDWLLNRLARALVHWWLYLSGDNDALKLCKASIRHLNYMIDNIDVCELKLCKETASWELTLTKSK